MKLKPKRIAHNKLTPEQARARFLSRISPEPNTGCWLWTGAVQSGGYGEAWIGGKSKKAHRAAYEFLVGGIPAGLDLMHHCDNRSCVNPDHLTPATTQENIDDMWRKGRGNPARGERNAKAKLTIHGVQRIHDLRDLFGMSSTEIGRRFEMHPSTVCRVLRGEAWRRAQ